MHQNIQEQVEKDTLRFHAAKEHVRLELLKVFKEHFYNLDKAEWSVNDLKLTIQFAKKQQGKSKKPNSMDTSA